MKGASHATILDTGAALAARRRAVQARRSTVRRTVAMAVCGAVLAVCGSALAARAGSTLQPPQRFSSGTELVRVDVLVSDGGRLVSGLTANDFEVRDRGVLQQVRQLDVETLAVDVICAFDTSGSVKGELLEHLAEGGRALLAGLRPDDRVALLAFGNRVSLLSPLGVERRAVAAGIDGLSGQGRTALRDAAFAALALREDGPARALVVLFSDGQDTASWLTSARVVDAARRTDVVVYPVTAGGAPREPAFLETLADETGGRTIRIDRTSDLRRAFTDVLSEFRTRYVLAYEPGRTAEKGWHPITVTLKRGRGRVTARRGYFAE